MDCYVYYKTIRKHEHQVLLQSEIMSVTLRELTGVDLHLQRRQEINNDVFTWMEIYRQIPMGFEENLAAIVNQTGLLSLIQGERHVEYFMDAISCA
ncbi:MAG: DUF4936 family protein [Cytophaga sp.]|nr:DUF4936 family protein [Undibacterium sp.]